MRTQSGLGIHTYIQPHMPTPHWQQPPHNNTHRQITQHAGGQPAGEGACARTATHTYIDRGPHIQHAPMCAYSGTYSGISIHTLAHPGDRHTCVWLPRWIGADLCNCPGLRAYLPVCTHAILYARLALCVCMHAALALFAVSRLPPVPCYV